MNGSTGLSWLAALKARRARRRCAEPDRADMGTAFGLDASFDPGEGDAPASRTAMPATPAPPWEYRLTRRSSL